MPALLISINARYKTRSGIRITGLPDGEAWYAYRLRTNTTTDLTPGQIHQLGLEMLEQVEREELTDVEEVHFRFALGKAMEDKKEYDKAWHFYDTGNRKHRLTVEHEPVRFERRMAAIRSVFDKDLLSQRAGAGFDRRLARGQGLRQDHGTIGMLVRPVDQALFLFGPAVCLKQETKDYPFMQTFVHSQIAIHLGRHPSC